MVTHWYRAPIENISFAMLQAIANVLNWYRNCQNWIDCWRCEKKLI
jgi:hypothetical protein